jgi:hypothetical protein
MGREEIDQPALGQTLVDEPVGEHSRAHAGESTVAQGHGVRHRHVAAHRHLNILTARIAEPPATTELRQQVEQAGAPGQIVGPDKRVPTNPVRTGTDTLAGLEQLAPDHIDHARGPEADGQIAGSFAPLFPVELVRKDLGYLSAAAAARAGVPAAARVFNMALRVGYGAEHGTAVVKLYLNQK